MLRIAFVGPTKVGKSSAINSLTGQRSATVGLINTTSKAAEYTAKLGDIDCTLIDTPADYPLTKLNNIDVVLYLTDVNDGEINVIRWSAFRDHFAAVNKTKTVPIQIAILITKCDTLPMPQLISAPPNVLIADDGNSGFYDNDLIMVIDSITKKYAEVCPVIPFNAHGRAAFHVNSMPDLIKSDGRKALSDGYIDLSVSAFYNIKCTGAEFVDLRQIMNMTDTLVDDIKKYKTCGRCKSSGDCTSSQCGEGYTCNVVTYLIDPINSYVNKVNDHIWVLKIDGRNHTYHKCLRCDKDEYNSGMIDRPSLCKLSDSSPISDNRCDNGHRACVFNVAHPCGQIANKLMALYGRTSSHTVRTAIIQFALNGQSQFGKTPNYNPEHWNLMSIHLTFDNDDLSAFGYKLAKTKDEAFRLLQFSRQKSIIEKIDIYCAALCLPVEKPDSLRIKCINGEDGIFADLPIKNLSDLKLIFNLIPTKRKEIKLSWLFSDLGKSQTYSRDILADLPKLVARINVDPTYYEQFGLFKV